jgi:class 3 adenylate cyclase
VAEDTNSTEAQSLVSGDIRGYTRFTQEHGDDAASELTGRFADLVREVVPTFEGELVELAGERPRPAACAGRHIAGAGLNTAAFRS